MNTTSTPIPRSAPLASSGSVSLLRLYALRVVYLIIAGGLATVVWPGLMDLSHPFALMDGVVACMLVSFSLMCALGVRYPLAMLPVLFWELIWKVLWLLRIALQAHLNGTMDASIEANVYACLLVVLIPLAMPWGHVWRTYVVARADRWR